MKLSKDLTYIEEDLKYIVEFSDASEEEINNLHNSFKNIRESNPFLKELINGFIVVEFHTNNESICQKSLTYIMQTVE